MFALLALFATDSIKTLGQPVNNSFTGYDFALNLVAETHMPKHWEAFQFVFQNPVPSVTHFMQLYISSTCEESKAQMDNFRKTAEIDFQHYIQTNQKFRQNFSTLDTFIHYVKQSPVWQKELVPVYSSIAEKSQNNIIKDVRIVPAQEKDFDEIWPIFQAVVSRGDTFYQARNTTKEEAHKIWMSPPGKPYIALLNNQIVGSYVIVPNYDGLGSRVANAGYMVRTDCRNQGMGRSLAYHSFKEAEKLGYIGIRFNMVASTNQPAIHLWQSVGMKIVGTVPDSFNHWLYGPVATYIMYKRFNNKHLNSKI